MAAAVPAVPADPANPAATDPAVPAVPPVEEVPKKPIQCARCKFTNGNPMLAHRINVCVVCDKAFPASSILKEHVKTCVPVTQDEQSLCGFHAQSVRAQSVRVAQTHHGAHGGHADQGGQAVHAAAALKKMESVKRNVVGDWSDLGRATNEYCSCETSGYHRAAHIERVYGCNKCKKGFFKRIGLQEHLIKHTGGIKMTLYECPQCGNIFISNKVPVPHGGREPFKCLTCAKNFGRKHELKTHIKSSHGQNPPFCCPECNTPLYKLLDRNTVMCTKCEKTF